MAEEIKTSLPQSTNTEQSFTNNGTKKEASTVTKGNGGDQIKSYEEATPCHRVTDSENGRIEQGTNIHTEATGDITVHAKGNVEIASDKCAGVTAPEKSQVSTTPNIVTNNPMQAADEAKKEVTAMRSGFSDNRNDVEPSLLEELLSIPQNILNGITKIISDDVDSETKKGAPEFSNLFSNPMGDIAKKVSGYANALKRQIATNITAQTEASTKNKNEKVEILKKRAEKMKDGATKDYYTQAAENKDLKKLATDPSSENKKVESTRDKDEEVNIAVKALNYLMDIAKLIS